MDMERLAKLTFTAEEINKCSKEDGEEVLFIKKGDKCQEEQEPYVKLLQDKLSSITGGIFKIVDPFKKSGSKNRRVYIICDCKKDKKGRPDRSASIRMPIYYQISEHKLNQELVMTWEMLCKNCKKLDDSNDQHESPEVVQNIQEPSIVEEPNNVELSEFDQATRKIQGAFDKYCIKFFNECKNMPNQLESLIQRRASFLIGLRNTLAESFDSLECNDHLAQHLNTGTPPNKQIVSPLAASNVQPSSSKQINSKRPLFLSPRALQAVNEQNDNIAKKLKKV